MIITLKWEIDGKEHGIKTELKGKPSESALDEVTKELGRCLKMFLQVNRPDLLEAP